MNNKKFRHFFGKVILVSLSFVIFNSAFGKQEVYLIDDPQVFKTAKTMLSNGIPPKEIFDSFKKNPQYMVKITPELVKEKFGIEWLEGGGNKILPEVVVVKMGSKLGYGLFAMTPIKSGQIVAEYTGKTLRLEDVVGNDSGWEEDPYLMDASGQDNAGKQVVGISAAKSGGAARFMQHLPGLVSLANCEFKSDTLKTKTICHEGITGGEEYYKWIDYNDKKQERSLIARANVEIKNKTDGRVFLVATETINPFEQIGFEYSTTYRWSVEPYLFYKDYRCVKDGLVSTANYEILRRLLKIVCGSATKDGEFPVATMIIDDEFARRIIKKGDDAYIPASVDGIKISYYLKVNYGELMKIIKSGMSVGYMKGKIAKL